MRITVFVSGTGSNLEAILKNDVPVALVVADRPCRGLEIAKNADVPAELVLRESFGKDFDRTAYTKRILTILREHNIGLIAMAGFMTVLEEPLFNEYGGRILNTHPSLLPLHKGDRAVQDALEAGAIETGCTIHIATMELDAGPILAQEKVPVIRGDSVETLHERIKKVERVLYPQVLKKILAGDIAL